MIVSKKVAVSLMLLTSLVACGGGDQATNMGNDSADSNTNDGDEGPDPMLPDDSQVPAIATCPAVGQDFGGDVVGNEYLDSDLTTSLLFGDSIGGNEDPNSSLVKRIQLNSCVSVSGLEFGSAYVVEASGAFAGAIDYAFEIRNVTDRLICDVSAEFDIRDAAGQRIQGNITTSTTAERYMGFAEGRRAAIPDSESGLLTGEQSSSCLRPNEIAYVYASELGRDTLLGQVLYDAFEEAAMMNVRSASFSGDEWVELPPLFSVSSYASPASNDNNVQIEFEIQDPTSEQVMAFEQLIPRQSIASAFIRYTILDSQGRPLYIGGSTGNLLTSSSATSRLAFEGSANSIRFRQGYRLNVEPR